MANLTSVTLTSGLGTGGTGTISTLDNLVGTAGSASAQVQTVQGVSSMTPVQVSQATAASLNATVVGTGTFATQSAATQSGTWTVQPGNTQNTTTWLVQPSDGTHNAVVKAASTAPVATDPALVVSISPNSVNSNGRKTPANSAPVVLNSQIYNTVAASQTAQALTGGSGGAAGDYLDGILVTPATTSPGNVLLLDNVTSITIFTGGASSVGSLVPFLIPIGAISASGAWKITTGSNVSCVAIGNFT